MTTTIIKSVRIASVHKISLITATLSEVLAGNISEETIDIKTIKGMLKDFHITCLSTDYNISIRQKFGITPPSVDEIFSYSNVNLEYSFSDYSLSFFNMDNPHNTILCLAIDNTAGINTGVITIKLVIEEA